jgi:iron complex outermembrane recepter protein
MSHAHVRIRRWTVAVLAAVAGAFSVAAVAQEATATEDTTKLEELTVTGSLIRKIDIETSLPVTTITRDQIRSSGVTDMEQLVRYLSMTSSVNAIATSALAGLSTYGQSSVSLRGLGDIRTLVLLNGRRLGVFAGTGTGVDINAIPLSAIDRVEVLRDGASTVYGSDAVAGVINFILRKDYNGAEVTAQVGRPTQSGGGGQTRYSILLGQGGAAGGKVNWLATANLDTSQALFARDRDFSANGNVPPYYFSGATETGRIEGIWIPGQSADENARDPDTNPFGWSTSGYGNPAAETCSTAAWAASTATSRTAVSTRRHSLGCSPRTSATTS